MYGTAGNELLFQNRQYELKTKIVVDEQQIERISHIFPFGQGFFVTDNKFVLYFFDKNDKDVKQLFTNT